MTGFRIEHLWAFISRAPDGEEGVVAMMVHDTWIPLIAADEKRLSKLRSIAEDIAHQCGPASRIKLVRFDVRVDLEDVEAF